MQNYDQVISFGDMQTDMQTDVQTFLLLCRYDAEFDAVSNKKFQAFRRSPDPLPTYHMLISCIGGNVRKTQNLAISFQFQLDLWSQIDFLHNLGRM